MGALAEAAVACIRGSGRNFSVAKDQAKFAISWAGVLADIGLSADAAIESRHGLSSNYRTAHDHAIPDSSNEVYCHVLLAQGTTKASMEATSKNLRSAIALEMLACPSE